MRRIKIFPAPHVELRVHVSDEMIKDYRECVDISRKSEGWNCKECKQCSWNSAEILRVCVCGMDEMQQLLEGECKESGTNWKAAVMRTFLGGRA